MTFAVMEEVDIFEVSPYTVTENFINYLHSILNISEDVDTSLHRSLSTSVQHLAGQLMKFMEGIGSNWSWTYRSLLFSAELFACSLHAARDIYSHLAGRRLLVSLGVNRPILLFHLRAEVAGTWVLLWFAVGRIGTEIITEQRNWIFQFWLVDCPSLCVAPLKSRPKHCWSLVSLTCFQ